MNKKNIFTVILLVLITLLGALLRGYQLGRSPSGFYIDEAGMGYSAYSILKTGKDEFGKPFPLIFRNFTDFKTPVYIYILIPFIAVFDLTVLTVRLPSAIFSTLTIPLLFFLVQKGAEKYRYKAHLSLLSALLLAISPWHVLFGRTSYECTIALFLYLAGIYLFLLSLKKPWICIASALIFALSIPAYHAERFLTPLTLLVLGWHYRKEIWLQKKRKFTIIGLLVGILITFPTLTISTTPGFLARAAGLNIFSHSRQVPVGTIENYTGSLNSLINGSWFLSTKEFLSLWMSYYSPRYMFNLGDYGPRSSYPELATFFIWELPFYLLGLFLLIKSYKNKQFSLGKLKWLTLFLLIITPIPAAITRDPYTTIRSLPLVIPQTILIGFGLTYVFKWLRGKKIWLGYTSLGLVIIYSVVQLYSSVIILNEYYREVEWDYGLKEVAIFLENSYTQVPTVVDNTRDEVYIQLAFFLKYDPATFQTHNVEVSPDEYYTNMNRVKEKKIGLITTRGINWQQDLKIEQFLVGDELAISLNQIKEHHLSLEKEIKYPDGSVAFRIVRTNPAYELREREIKK